MFALALLLSVGIGATLGAVGSGGSLLTLPVLVYVLRIPPTTAVPMSLVLVGAASAGATLLRWRQRDVHWQALVLLTSTGVVGAYFGSALTHLIPSSVLMTLFAVILLLVGLVMLQGADNRIQTRECRIPTCLTAGGVVGLLTGFLGVGGGFLLVPALIVFAGLDMRQAVGTSVGIISVNSLAGILGQLRFTGVDWRVTGSLLTATMVGIIFGIAIGRRLSEHALRRALAFVMIVVGVWVVAANLIAIL